MDNFLHARIKRATRVASAAFPTRLPDWAYLGGGWGKYERRWHTHVQGAGNAGDELWRWASAAELLDMERTGHWRG